MKTPKYKLGDIIQSHDGSIELITSLIRTRDGVRYITKHLDGIFDGCRGVITKSEWSIDMFYTVIGNVLYKNKLREIR